MLRDCRDGRREYVSPDDNLLFIIAGRNGSSFINIHHNGRTILSIRETSGWTDDRIMGYCDGWVAGMYDGKAVGRSGERVRLRELLGLGE